MPDRMVITMITHTRFGQPDGQSALLDAFEQHPATAPTHWGPDERARNSYSRAEVMAYVRDNLSDFLSPGLRRRKAPSYDAYFSTKHAALNSMTASFAANLTDKNVRQIFTLGDVLAQRLTPAYGFVHSIWKRGEESQNYSAAGVLDAQEFQASGPQAPCLRTWFGPHIVNLIGKERLISCDVPVYETDWGGVQLDLVGDPWEADFKTARARQQMVLAHVQSSGVFGDYSVPFEAKPGPRWTPVPVPN